MEFTNEFTIPLGIDEAFAVLTDLEKVAPCMPGATLTEVEGTTYGGRMKVKVGPMSLTYEGTATLQDEDATNHTARIEAAGREKRGAGTAAADVSAHLVEKDGQTVVTVVTDINITGKPASFGRGVMADVGAKIVDRFAANLQDMLEEDDASPADEADAAEVSTAGPTSSATGTVPATSDGTDAASGPRKIAYQAPRDDALDLVAVASEATIKRLAPVIGAAVLVLVYILWRRGRSDT